MSHQINYLRKKPEHKPGTIRRFLKRAALIVAAVVLMTAPVRDDADNERYAKQQQAAKVAANKRLFMKLYVQAEEMTFPLAAYGSEGK